MSAKAMIFIDGSWLYHSRQALFDALGANNGFEIDYNRIPDIITQAIAESLGENVDLIRTNYFGTIPVNKVGFNPAKQMAFYDFLAIQCGYDTEIVPIDFRKDPDAKPDDKWVNVALAAAMMQYAMIPAAVDIVVLVGGHSDYIPLLRRVRAAGKRVFLVAMNSTSPRNTLTSPALLTEPGLLDFPPLFLDQHSEDIRLVRAEQIRVCKTCGREEKTTWAGPEFFCSVCRANHNKTVRKCDVCGTEEETTWDKPGFICSTCRRKQKAIQDAQSAQ
ncbi:MAG: NYN domain-containing protein [Kiritimatiellia bacterium]